MSRRIELNDFDIDATIYGSMLRAEVLRQYRNWIVGFAALYVALIVYASRDAEGPVGVAIASARLILWAAGLYWLFTRWYPRYSARRPENRFQFGTYRVVLSGDRLEVEQSNGALFVLPLKQVVRLSKHATHLLLSVNLATLLIIPRSAFKSSDDEAAFEAALAEETASA